MTYEGSTTHPGCWESTVWIILNKPIYITKQEVSESHFLHLLFLLFEFYEIHNNQADCFIFHAITNRFISLQLYALRRLMQGSEQTPKAPLGNNARLVQSLNHRTVRTNIDFKQSKVIYKIQLISISFYFCFSLL